MPEPLFAASIFLGLTLVFLGINLVARGWLKPVTFYPMLAFLGATVVFALKAVFFA